MAPAGSAGWRPLLARLLAAALAAATLSATAPLAPPAAAAEEAAPAPDLQAASWVLLDARDGERLAAHAASQPRAIASTTKLMTAYVALQRLPLDRRLTVPAYSPAPAESVAGLVEGERLSLHDLLLAMMLPSANDAAETVALGVAPTEEVFVERMNDAAADLGLGGTSYSNPIGLDDPLNFSTASDLGKLALELHDDRRFRRIVDRPEATLQTGSVERHLVNLNTLLRSDPSVDGIKTGHTLDAGYVLVASAKRMGVPLVSVVLGAPSEAARDSESERLLDYGYSLYERRSPFRAGERLDFAAVAYDDAPLALLAKRPLPVVARADQDLAVELSSPGAVEGPIEEGQPLGRATVSLDGRRAGSVPLVAARAIAEPGLIDRLGGGWLVGAVVAVVIVILLSVAVVLRRAREGQRDRNAARRSG